MEDSVDRIGKEESDVKTGFLSPSLLTPYKYLPPISDNLDNMGQGHVPYLTKQISLWLSNINSHRNLLVHLKCSGLFKILDFLKDIKLLNYYFYKKIQITLFTFYHVSLFYS